MRKIALLLVLVVLASGCIGQAADTERVLTEADDVKIHACRDLCEDAKAKGTDLSNGPCLSNDLGDGWVCDVAHWPRQAVDNDPANQCPAYGITASHFVEFDENCEFIRAS
ncbi:MAG: hypothetical protein ACE5J7_00510 [Candidatus Aenigmatarchaeota archaeon]